MQEVVFQYTGYNESATSIDSSYRQGRPAQTQLGTGGLIPGALCNFPPVGACFLP